MTGPTIEFFWDAASPYTYLASTQIDALAGRHGAQVDWKPFLLGKVFEATGNRPPALIPAKGRHLVQDLGRWAELYAVPFHMASVFPVNSIAGLRIACALPAERRGDWAKALMHAYWVEDRDIGQPDVLTAVADALGLDGPALQAQAQLAEVKNALRANTAEAVDRGVFGAPAFFIGTRMYWGNDRLVLLESDLKGQRAA